MQTDVALGEIFLNTFVLRRVYLIANSVGDAVLIEWPENGIITSCATLSRRLSDFIQRLMLLCVPRSLGAAGAIHAAINARKRIREESLITDAAPALMPVHSRQN